ncbi:TPA: hypothetical protein NGR52_004263 [Vibrio parahaemolyticus]|nr:hypothetical protein [Vibrio parahaemolyticus]
MKSFNSEYDILVSGGALKSFPCVLEQGDEGVTVVFRDGARITITYKEYAATNHKLELLRDRVFVYKHSILYDHLFCLLEQQTRG